MNEQNSSVKKRLLEFIDYLQVSVRAFESRCGMAYGYVANISKGIGAEKLQNILNAYPQLNSDWLIKGEGEMLRGVSNAQTGDGNNNQQGDGNVYRSNDEKAFRTLMQVVDVNQRTADNYIEIIRKSQEQIDRLIALLERKLNV